MNYKKFGNFASVSVVIFLILFFSACKKDTNLFGKKPSNPDTQIVFKNIVYGKNFNWQGEQEDLKMDIYLPKNNSNQFGSKKYPVLIFIHGGGFQVGDKATIEGFATLMNQKGYAVAAINYRLGWTENPVEDCSDSTAGAVEAAYRAIQDTRASLRFIAANADKYQLDANWVFIGGSSAGSISALNAAYYTSQTADLQFPGFAKKLGPLDAGNDYKNNYSIKAIINMWGAINDINLITKYNAKPTISFHGMQDDVVSYNVGHFNSCKNTQLGYGSKPIYDRLNGFGISTIAHLDPDGGHGVYDKTFQTNNIACFLNGVMINKKQSGLFYNLDGDCAAN